MKKHLLALILVPFILAGCGNNNSNTSTPSSSVVESTLTLSDYEISIMEGDQYQLNATTTSRSLIFFTSRDDSIVSISEDGLITAKKVGATSIFVLCGKDTAVCTVEVTPYTARATLSIEIPKDSYTIANGDTFNLPIVSKFGNEVVEANINYVIGNEDAISIENGLIKALSVGESELLVTASYNSYSASKGILIKVI